MALSHRGLRLTCADAARPYSPHFAPPLRSTPVALLAPSQQPVPKYPAPQLVLPMHSAGQRAP
eukprot:15248220-Alexandrium_andersonii.AAC.1